MNKGSPALTEREKETLRLLLTGHDAKSVAGVLGLSVHTVNERLREARRKLGVSSSREAARRLREIEQRDHDFLRDEQFGVVPAILDPKVSCWPDRPRNEGWSLVWLGGGMLIMSLIIAGTVLMSAWQGNAEAISLSMAGSPASVGRSRQVKSQGMASARAWVALLDGKRWDESWSAAGTQFKSQVAKTQWASMVQAVLRPLGKVASRAVSSVTATTSLPGAPSGQYEVIEFRTDFESKHDAVETVIVVRESSGWKVVGYFIR